MRTEQQVQADVDDKRVRWALEDENYPAGTLSAESRFMEIADRCHAAGYEREERS